MSTDPTPDSADRPDDQRDTNEQTYSAEWAYPQRRETPAWKRSAPDLSGGWIDVHRAMCGDTPIGHEEVTSS